MARERHDEAVYAEAKAGRVEFRVDRTSNLHVPVGKVGFDSPQLLGNISAFMDAVRKARPPAAKGTYVRKVVFAACMGPGIKVDPVLALAMEVA